MSEAAKRIFISATAEDLRLYVASAKKAIEKMEWVAVHHSAWPASGRRSVRECRERVAGCDALVVLVAHRYGWVPTESDEGDGERSITWIEVDAARDADEAIPVIPLLVSEERGVEWPVDQIEGLEDPQAMKRLGHFKAQLRETLAGFFTTPESVEHIVYHALSKLELPRREKMLHSEKHRVAEPAPLLPRYLTQTEAHYRDVRLLGFGERFQVTLPIADLYVPLRASLARSFEVDDEGSWTFDEKKLERAEQLERNVPVTEAFRRAHECGGGGQENGAGLRGVALLGDPGAGKTTAARQLCWQTASPAHGPSTLDLPDGTIPVLIRLRRLRKGDVAKGRGFKTFLRREIASWCDPDDGHLDLDGDELIETLFAHDHVLWLFDGLDEVADLEARTKVSRWIERHLENNAGHRVLVTSRYAGYQAEARLGGAFVELHVQPLDDDQQAAFVSQWYHTVESQVRIGEFDKAEGIAAERTASLTEILQGPDFRGQRLATIAANPLLLSVLCIVHRKDVELPRKRAGLYEKCVAVLLEHWKHEWRKEQGVAGIDIDAARALLQPLAWWLHQEEDRTEASAEELTEPLAGALRTLANAPIEVGEEVEFLERIRDDTGLLVTPNPGRFGFLHLSFQEYLAAQHAVEAEEATDLASHFGKSWWNEVTLLALSQAPLKYAEEFYDSVLGRLWSKRREPSTDERDLLNLAFNETLHLPLSPCLERIEKGPIARRRVLLHLLRERKDPELVELARALADHDDPTLSSTAREILVRAGERVPATPRGETATAGRGAAPGTEDQWIHEPTGMVFVPIPGGKFLMGSPKNEPGRDDDEGPQHEVTVPPLWIAKYPVTNAQYATFIEETSHAKPKYWTDSHWNQPNQPVVGVSWKDAKAFCEWATSGVRLPSEAEWEYACRAGTTTAYSFGDDPGALGDHAWFQDNAGGRTHSVGEKRPNSWGLHDMHGNVWEWCEDTWHPNYEGAPDNGTAWLGSGSGSRVIRGGSWRSPARDCRSAFRNGNSADDRWFDVGFRPARSPSRE